MVYPIGKWVVYFIYRPWIKKVRGLDYVPMDIPFIIAANHSSYFDSLLLYCTIIPKINKKIHALVNRYYWKNFITRLILNWGECIPVFVEQEKNSKEKNILALERALNYLKKNEPITLFPEGRRSIDGKLRKAYNGVARLALESKVPVLPIGIIGADKVIPVGKILPRFTRCKVKIGKLIYFEKYYYKKVKHRQLEEITRSIMKEIAKLIGQRYKY